MCGFFGCVNMRERTGWMEGMVEVKPFVVICFAHCGDRGVVSRVIYPDFEPQVPTLSGEG